MRPKIPQVLKAGGRTIHFLVNVPGRRQRDPAALSGPHHLARAETFGPESLAVHSAAHWYVVQRFKSQVLRLLTPNSVLGWYITYINILENICENIYIYEIHWSQWSLYHQKNPPIEPVRSSWKSAPLKMGVAKNSAWRSNVVRSVGCGGPFEKHGENHGRTMGEPWDNHGITRTPALGDSPKIHVVDLSGMIQSIQCGRCRACTNAFQKQEFLSEWRHFPSWSHWKQC